MSTAVISAAPSKLLALPRAEAAIAPAFPMLRPGTSVLLRAEGFEGEVDWQVEASGERVQPVRLVAEGGCKVRVLLPAASTLDTIVFVRATSRTRPQQTVLSPVRVMPAPEALRPAAPRPVVNLRQPQARVSPWREALSWLIPA